MFYDLNVGAMDVSPYAQSRLLTIIRDFKPQMVIVTTEPMHYGRPAKMLLINWMRSQACFKQIYVDSLGCAFEVRDGWQKLFRDFPPVEPPPRMGG